MALLTKHERRNLDADERKALRAERRAARPKKGINIKIDWDGLLDRAQTLILDLIGDDIPGPRKMDEVLASLSEEADDWLKWEKLGVVGLLLEAIDGPLISALFGALVKPQIQRLYEQMVADGKIKTE